MHIVQLLLEIVDLLLDRSLPVELLLIALLGVLCFLGYFRDLDKFADRIGDQVISGAERVGREDLVFFLRRQVQIIRQRACEIADVFSLQDKAPCPKPPLIALYKLEKGGAEPGELLLLLALCHICGLRADGSRGGDPAV